MADPKSALRQLETMKPVTAYGKVNKIVGLVAEGSGIRAPVGSLCHILPEAGQAAGAPLPKQSALAARGAVRRKRGV